MKFILSFCILMGMFTFNTSQSSKQKPSPTTINKLGKNIPVDSIAKYKEVPITRLVNDNHFIIPTLVPDCEMICK